jgi:hypothetical protein
MTLVLQWRQPRPPVILRWRGFDDHILAARTVLPEGAVSIPTIIGPPGPAGQMPETIDCGTFQ